MRPAQALPGPPSTGDPDATFDVLVCASPADIDGLLRVCLELLLRNFEPLGRIHLVTPQPDDARRLLAAWPRLRTAGIDVRSDNDLCPEARDLPPWFRQQYIKLHADRLGATSDVVCVGADTLILDTITVDDLISRDGRPLLRYFRYGRPNPHLPFERQRVFNVARLLCVEPSRSLLPGDFICDLFLFRAHVLRALRARLAERQDLLGLLHGLGPRQGADNRFGEWTAYAVFCLDVIGADVQLVPSTPRFFRQIHSRSDLERHDRFSSRIVHFAAEPGGSQAVLNDLGRAGRLPPDLVCAGDRESPAIERSRPSAPTLIAGRRIADSCHQD